MNEREPHHSSNAPLWALFAFLGSIVGGSFIAFLSTGGIKADGISYVDLAAILLASVTLVLTVLGLAIAIAAIYGYRAFMKTSAAAAASVAKREAVPAAIAEVNSYIAREANDFLTEQAEAVALRVLSPERLTKLIQERVDAYLVGDRRDDEVDQDEDEVGPALPEVRGPTDDH